MEIKNKNECTENCFRDDKKNYIIENNNNNVGSCNFN